MCTLTTFISDDSILVGFNRDEQLARQRALPPQRYTDEGVTYLCPVDPVSSGTWIGVNQFGVLLCLLNYYDKTPDVVPGKVYRSRGLLVKMLLRCSSLEHLYKQLALDDLSTTMPFRLVGFSLGAIPMQVAWDGERLEKETLENPVVSSSYDVVACRQTRGDAFRSFGLEEGCDNFQSLLRYHASHEPEKGPLSVCVHRPDVETVSFTGIQLRHDGASMVYTDGSPCASRLCDPVTIRFSDL
jgi:hypothetical protein